MSAHADASTLPAPAFSDAPQDALPRLLKGVRIGEAMTLEEHIEVHGPLPAPVRRRERDDTIEMIERAGLRGRGGGWFPTAAKMRAVAASRRRPVVVVNAVEAEPGSAKDRTLIAGAPHLVLDGALLAARALGADEVLVGVSSSATRPQLEALSAAIIERAGGRTSRIAVTRVPGRYVAGHESALIGALNGRKAVPSFAPPAPFERGVGTAPTLVSNVETFAHIALICRYGPGWFRELGTREQPGSSLVTVSGAVADPGVYEIGIGVRLRELVSACGGATSAPRAALIGGLGGTWIGPGDLAGIELCDDALAAHGASIGAGVVVLLDEDACPVAETLRIVRWLADQSARQCGPCVNGLAAISAELASVAGGHRAADPVRELERLSALVLGRGACALPDGVSALVVSAIDVFREEFAEHASAGPCEGCLQPPRLSLPVLDAGDTIAASRRARALTGERR